MKILFAQPRGVGYPPLGMMYLSAMLKSSGHSNTEVCCISEHAASATERRTIEYFEKQLKKKPGLVGISCTTSTWTDAVPLAKSAKESGATVIAGGPGPSSLKEKILQNFDFVDAVVVGEAERNIVEIAERTENGKSFDGIKGVIFRRGKSIVANKPMPLIEDLDSLPFPDRDCVDLISYPNAFSVLSSRGCPYNCVFCFKPVHGRAFRARSPKNVVDEIEFLLENYPRVARMIENKINFADDVFNFNLKRAKRIADEIINRRLGIKISFDNGFHARNVDLELFQKIKQAGCTNLFFGIESGSAPVLKRLGKGITPEIARNAVMLAKKAGIEKVGAHFVIGLPGSNLKRELESIEFARSLGLDDARFKHANILPDSRLCKWVEKNAKPLFETGNLDYSRFLQTSLVPLFETKDFSKEERENAFAEASKLTDSIIKKKVFLPKRAIKTLLKIRCFDDACWLFSRAIRKRFGKKPYA